MYGYLIICKPDFNFKLVGHDELISVYRVKVVLLVLLLLLLLLMATMHIVAIQLL